MDRQDDGPTVVDEPRPIDRDLLRGLDGQRAGFLELARFLRPFLRPQARSLSLAFAFGVIALAAAAIVPLVVEGILTHDYTNRGRLALLVGLVAVDVIATWLARRWSFRTAAEVARALSSWLYEQTSASSVLRQVGLRRPSVISRHTSDIDRIEEALDVTVAEGIPGAIQIVLSLILLCYVEVRVGLIMVIVTALFVVVYLRIGRSMLMIDKRRLDASSDVGALVDESITASRAETGLNLVTWMSERFAVRAARLHEATIEQKRQVTRLYVAARTAGHIALLGIVVLAIVGGQAEAGAIAAALLYIDAVVRGMEALPPWLREVRLAVTSKRRIQQITLAPPLVNRDLSSVTTMRGPGLVLDRLSAMTPNDEKASTVTVGVGGVVAVVSDLGASSGHLLEEISGEIDPERGAVFLDGLDVRHPLIKRRIMLVANEHHLMDASVAEHLRAAAPDLDDDGITIALERTGLGHLVELPQGGVNARLGTHAQMLSVHERQRLMLAMALVGDADVIAVEDLPVLSDPDTAAPLIAGLLERPNRTLLMQTTNPEVAARADAVLTQIGMEVLYGTHAELMHRAAYSALWERQVTGGVDTRILEMIDPSSRDAVRSRLMTEHFSAGETLFRAGSPADRLLYVVTGRVEVLAIDDDGHERRVAEIGRGNFCGDVSSPGARHRETVRAVVDTMVRTLSVEAWSAGILGLLDADPVDRRVLTAILRSSSPTVLSLQMTLADLPDEDVRQTVHRLVDAGQLRVNDKGQLSVTSRRRSLAGSSALLDRLALDVEPPRSSPAGE